MSPVRHIERLWGKLLYMLRYKRLHLALRVFAREEGIDLSLESVGHEASGKILELRRTVVLVERFATHYSRE